MARALANRPPLLLADEPTGRLDSTTSTQVMELLEDLRRDHGVTLLIVTHDPQVAALADRVVHMLDGHIDTDETPSLPEPPRRGSAGGTVSAPRGH